MATALGFGRLQRVNLNDVWLQEAEDFTSWLASQENIDLLGEAVGLELFVEAQKDVDRLRASVLCKETALGRWVLVGTQLERADNNFLGQLITDAAGLPAVTIIWIAERFSEQHRTTIDWLNQITDDRLRFFGLDIELWRIGTSHVAPRFNLVCKPDGWNEKTEAAAPQNGALPVDEEPLSETKKLQLDFWTSFCGFVEEHGHRVKPTKPLPQHWMSMALGRSGVYLGAVAATSSEEGAPHELRAEVVIATSDAKTFFAGLEAQKLEIEVEMGETLGWYNPPERRTCRIFVRKPASLNQRNHWPKYQVWLLEKLEKLHKVFGPRVKQVDPISTSLNSLTAVASA